MFDNDTVIHICSMELLIRLAVIYNCPRIQRTSKNFSYQERGSNKFSYCQCKVLKNSIYGLITKGFTSDTGIDWINHVYGHRVSIVKNLKPMAKDKQGRVHQLYLCCMVCLNLETGEAIRRVVGALDKNNYIFIILFLVAMSCVSSSFYSYARE